MSGYISYKFCEYLGTEIPTHWNDKKLGYLSNQTRNAFVDGPFGSDLKSKDYQDDGIPLIQLNNIRDSTHVIRNMKFVSEIKKKELIRHIAYPGDIVFAKMAEPVARATIVSGFYNEYIIVADCIKMEPNEKISNPDYLIWAINCDEVRINAELVSTGTTRIRINLSELKKLKIPFPPIPEQTQIAAFLDHETAKIDTLIDKQQQLIELLKEKRQAVISHTVTKGLDPDVPMKDSGVDWLGEVPEHWKVLAIKKIVSTPITDGPHETPNFIEEGVSFISAEAISSGVIDFSKQRACISIKDHIRFSEKYKPHLYDIYMVKSGATTGVSAIVETINDFNIWSPLAAIRCSEIAFPYFVLYFLRSQQFLTAIELNWSFGTQQNIGMGVIGNIYISCPPIKEAIMISDHIRQKCSKIENLITLATHQISLMQERRTALISAAVTGKIDVRDWQVPVTQTESDEVMA